MDSNWVNVYSWTTKNEWTFTIQSSVAAMNFSQLSSITHHARTSIQNTENHMWCDGWWSSNHYILLLFILFDCSQKYGHKWILFISKCGRNFRLRLLSIENGLRLVTYEQIRKHHILSVAQSSIKHNGISIFLFLVFIIVCASNS